MDFIKFILLKLFESEYYNLFKNDKYYYYNLYNNL